MAFRDVSVVQAREVLRRWLRGQGERLAVRGAGVGRKTARRYVPAAIEVGLARAGGESQLTEELVGQVCEAVRPSRPDGRGPALTGPVAHCRTASVCVPNPCPNEVARAVFPSLGVALTGSSDIHGPWRGHPLRMKLVACRPLTPLRLTGALSPLVRLALEPAGTLDCCREHVCQILFVHAAPLGGTSRPCDKGGWQWT